MDLKDRTNNFLTEFIALCERHGAAVITDGKEPTIIFSSRENLRRYVDWWEDECEVLETDDFEDFL